MLIIESENNAVPDGEQRNANFGWENNLALGNGQRAMLWMRAQDGAEDVILSRRDLDRLLVVAPHGWDAGCYSGQRDTVGNVALGHVPTEKRNGRVLRYHLPDTMAEQDLRAVALHHMPEATEPILSALVQQALSSEGYCGAMVNAIRRARIIARGEDKPVTVDIIRIAQAEAARKTRIEKIAANSRSNRRSHAS